VYLLIGIGRSVTHNTIYFVYPSTVKLPNGVPLGRRTFYAIVKLFVWPDDDPLRGSKHVALNIILKLYITYCVVFDRSS
jgi:hypothetical protein